MSEKGLSRGIPEGDDHRRLMATQPQSGWPSTEPIPGVQWSRVLLDDRRQLMAARRRLADDCLQLLAGWRSAEVRRLAVLFWGGGEHYGQ